MCMCVSFAQEFDMRCGAFFRCIRWCFVSGGVSFGSFLLQWHVRKLILLVGETFRGGGVYGARVSLWKFQESVESRTHVQMTYTCRQHIEWS